MNNLTKAVTSGLCASLVALTALCAVVPAQAAPTTGSNQASIKRNTRIAMQNRKRLMQNRKRGMQNRRMIMQNRRMIKSHNTGTMTHTMR